MINENKLKKKEGGQTKKVDRKVLSFFLLLFPSLIISLASSTWVRLALLVYQAILLKQFVEDYYAN